MTGNDRLAMRYLERSMEALEVIAKSLNTLQSDVRALTQRRILGETPTTEIVAELHRRAPLMPSEIEAFLHAVDDR